MVAFDLDYGNVNVKFRYWCCRYLNMEVEVFVDIVREALGLVALLVSASILPVFCCFLLCDYHIVNMWFLTRKHIV